MMKKFISVLAVSAMLITGFAGCAPVRETSLPVRSESSSGGKYADWLSEKIGDSLGEVVICDTDSAEKYGVDVSDYEDGGYVIKKISGQTVIAGKGELGIDRAVHYFAKNGGNGDMNVSEGEGKRVGAITVDGTPIQEYSIRVPSEAPADGYIENAEYAAEVIAKYIEQACGANLSVTTDTADRQIVLEYDSAEDDGDSFSINVTDGNIIITGSHNRGLLYGAYSFLENVVGYRFLTRGVTYLDKSDEIALKSGYTHSEGSTPFKWRDVYTFIDGKTVLYPPGALNNNYSESRVALHLNAGWGQGSWINTPKYGYAEGSDRNHSMLNLVPSSRDGVVCFSSDYTFEECMENLVPYIDGFLAKGYRFGVNMPQISLSANDTDSWCMCSDCSNIIRKYGAKSATLIKFIERISNALLDESVYGDKYKGIEFWTLAYLGSEQPPRMDIDVPENLHICFCMYPACNNHSADGSECTNSYYKTHWTYLKRWCELSDNVDLWYYACHFNYSLVAAPIIHQVLSDLKSFADLGVKGIFIQNEETTLGFDDLSSYIFSKMLWNPYMTVEECDALIAEFCRIFYGDTDGKILEYYNILEKAGDNSDCFCLLSDAPYRVYNYSFLEQRFDYCAQLFESAINNCNSLDQEARLKRLSCHMYFLGICASWNDKYVNGTSEEKAVITERYKLMYDRLDEIRDTIMFGVFTDDKLPEKFNPDENPQTWLTPNGTW